jgi:hypothetical protein
MSQIMMSLVYELVGVALLISDKWVDDDSPSLIEAILKSGFLKCRGVRKIYSTADVCKFLNFKKM